MSDNNTISSTCSIADVRTAYNNFVTDISITDEISKYATFGIGNKTAATQLSEYNSFGSIFNFYGYRSTDTSHKIAQVKVIPQSTTSDAYNTQSGIYAISTASLANGTLTEALRITNEQKVLIGNTTDSGYLGMLQVSGNIDITKYTVFGTSSDLSIKLGATNIDCVDNTKAYLWEHKVDKSATENAQNYNLYRRRRDDVSYISNKVYDIDSAMTLNYYGKLGVNINSTGNYDGLDIGEIFIGDNTKKFSLLGNNRTYTYKPVGAADTNGNSGSRDFKIWTNGLGTGVGSTSGSIFEYDGLNTIIGGKSESDANFYGRVCVGTMPTTNSARLQVAGGINISSGDVGVDNGSLNVSSIITATAITVSAGVSGGALTITGDSNLKNVYVASNGRFNLPRVRPTVGVVAGTMYCDDGGGEFWIYVQGGWRAVNWT